MAQELHSISLSPETRPMGAVMSDPQAPLVKFPTPPDEETVERGLINR
jgi:hypothetical protein